MDLSLSTSPEKAKKKARMTDESEPRGGSGQVVEKKEVAPVKTAPKKEDTKPAPVKVDGPVDRKKLEAIVKKNGLDSALELLSKTRVVDLRSLAREFNGEFGIAGREITHANKKALVDEFRKFFKK
ncbi:MAG: hypothetical protein IKE49_04415 [Firmicutes bacterium]|nr:hypothetical protein [Bacillota bacterium]